MLSGCDSTQIADGYEAELRYPLRTDPIVLELPTTVAERPRDAMTIDELVKRLPSLGGKIIEPATISDDQQRQLTAALDHEFGTPAVPLVQSASQETVAALGLDPPTLHRGSVLYRVRCADCHGLPGHGRGPTAANIQPRPRDFRSGLFKFSSSEANTGKPRFDDLRRVLRRGVPGTPMPIFDLLPDADVRALNAYTVHLSVRGEVELRLLRRMLIDDEELIANIAQAVQATTQTVLASWMASQTVPTKAEPPTVPDDSASIRRGHALFTNAAGGASCLSCHESYGKKEVFRFDAWGQPARVANLTEPQYRWGGEPTDLARRVRHGIRPANMPANPTLTDQQVQDLVAFILALPYAEQLPADVRQAIDK